MKKDSLPVPHTVPVALKKNDEHVTEIVLGGIMAVIALTGIWCSVTFFVAMM